MWTSNQFCVCFVIVCVCVSWILKQTAVNFNQWDTNPASGRPITDRHAPWTRLGPPHTHTHTLVKELERGFYGVLQSKNNLIQLCWIKKNANAAHGLQIFIVAMDVELSESICSRCLFFFCSNSILPSRPCESDFAVEWLRVHNV